MTSTSAWSVWVVVLVPTLLAVAVFANTIGHSFTYDDRAAVAYNHDLHGSTPWTTLFSHDFWGARLDQDGSHKSYRPITVATFRFNYWLSGLNPTGFHATNILLHAAVTGVFAWLVHTTVGGKLRSLLAGCLFAAHAVHVESVASVVGRADVVCAVFALAALVAYRRAAVDAGATSFGWLAAAIVLVLLGTLGKEGCITTFAALCAYDMLLVHLPRAVASSERGHVLPVLKASVGVFRQRAVMVRWALMFVAGVTFMAVRLSVHGNVKVKPWTRMENRFAHMPPGMPRMLSVAYSHVLYVWVMLCPWRLSFEWGLGSSPLFHTWFEYRSLWVVGVYSAAAAVLVHCLRQHKFAALWGLAWAFASWLPSSNVLVFVGTEYAERLMYLPSLGLILGVACCLPKDVDLACNAGSNAGGGSNADAGASGGGGGAAAAAGKSAAHRCCKHAHPNYVLVAGIALLAIAANAARTVSYNRAWANEYRLFRSGLDTNPLAVRAANNYAVVLARGSYAERIQAWHYNLRALAVLPDYPGPQLNLALLYRDTFHRKDLAYIHFRECVYGRRLLTSVQECHQSQAELLLERLREGHKLSWDGLPIVPLVERHNADSDLLGGRSKALHMMNVAELELLTGSPQQALEKVEDALRVWQAEAATKKVSVGLEKILCVKGDTLGQLGLLQEAVQAYGEANRYMATARACLGIATLLVNNGQHEDAEVHFANADHVRSFRHKQRLDERTEGAVPQADVHGLILAGHGYGNSPTLLLNLNEDGTAIPTAPREARLGAAPPPDLQL